MKPVPLASCGARSCGDGWKLRKNSSMSGRVPRCRALATRVVWIDTTLGVTWSAMASKALPVSASDCTCDDDGFDPFEPSCANPNRVRSRLDAKRSPQTNAVTTATPRRTREKLVGILGYPLLKRCCDPLSVLYKKTGALCSHD